MPEDFSDRPVDSPFQDSHPLPDGEQGESAKGLTLAFTNQKGGVGKTTTAVNLGACLAEAGARVLLIDLDPQGNASTGVGVDRSKVSVGVYEVLSGSPIEDAIQPTAVDGLWIVPSTIDLAGAEIELVSAFAREMKLRHAVEPILGRYDFVLIDSPPSLGLLSINALAAANRVVVPIQCEYYALEGLGQLLRTLDLVREGLNPALDVGGVVMTMFDARTKLSEQVVAEIRRHFGDTVFRTVIPRSVRLSEAPGYGKPIIHYESSSRAAAAYRWLAEEVLARWPVARLAGPLVEQQQLLGFDSDRAAASFEPATGAASGPAGAIVDPSELGRPGAGEQDDPESPAPPLPGQIRLEPEEASPPASNAPGDPDQPPADVQGQEPAGAPGPYEPWHQER